MVNYVPNNKLQIKICRIYGIVGISTYISEELFYSEKSNESYPLTFM